MSFNTIRLDRTVPGCRSGFLSRLADELYQEEHSLDELPDLLSDLHSPDSQTRAAAAWALGTIGEPSTVPALLEALRDPDQQVRWTAADSLRLFGSAATQGLLEALRDPEPYVRQAAARALRDVGSIAALLAVEG